MPSNESKVALEMAMVVACSAMSSTALHVRRVENCELTPICGCLDPFVRLQEQYRSSRMNHAATVQTRGKVTIPAEVRQALLVRPGDEVNFVETEPGRFELQTELRRPALLRRDAKSRTSMPVERRTAQLKLPI
jgi:AbrB family looped-hinge helix DNA binding protein